MKKLYNRFKLLSLEIDHYIFKVCFYWYEKKVISETVNFNSRFYKFWINYIESRNARVYDEISNLREKLY